MTLHCHPAEAWRLMKQGLTLKQVAAMAHDEPAELDRAIWDWRSDISGAVTPQPIEDNKRWCAEEAAFDSGAAA